MSENKTNSSAGASAKAGKYFKYAIGEIVLVVIGILIALQINNWNEDRKDANFEIKMLNEVKVALQNDLRHYHRMAKRVKIADSATTKFIQYYHNKISMNDSLYPLFRDLRIGIQMQQNYGPYQGIKSAGINKISNDSLRKSLVNFYDFEYPRNFELLKWYDKSYDDHMERLSLFNQKPYTILNKKDSIVIYSEYPMDILRNPEFLSLLRDFKFRITSTLRNFNYTILEIQELISKIEKELGDD